MSPTAMHKMNLLASIFCLILLVENVVAQTVCIVGSIEACPKEDLDDNGVNFVYPGGDTRCGFDVVEGEENPYYFQVQKVCT
jgi:hypothetical protein